MIAAESLQVCGLHSCVLAQFTDCREPGQQLLQLLEESVRTLMGSVLQRREAGNTQLHSRKSIAINKPIKKGKDGIGSRGSHVSSLIVSCSCPNQPYHFYLIFTVIRSLAMSKREGKEEALLTKNWLTTQHFLVISGEALL